jgi:YD repeat-containing protein
MEEAIAAMKVAHADRTFQPRVESLAEYDSYEDLINGKIIHYFKIDLAEEAVAPIFDVFWETSWRNIVSTESEAVAEFLDYVYNRTHGGPAFHCEYPTYVGMTYNTRTSNTRRQGRTARVPDSIPLWRVFYDTEKYVGQYIAELWLPHNSPPGGSVWCGFEKGGPQYSWADEAGFGDKITVYLCPEGYNYHHPSLATFGVVGKCKLVQIKDSIEEVGRFALLSPPEQCKSPKEGNPCNPATGGKSQTETDFTLANGTLKVQRAYNSYAVEDGYINMGPRWRHNYSQRVDGYWEEGRKRVLPGKRSSLYDSPRDACTHGWNEIKAQRYGGMLSEAAASYSSGMCNVRSSNGVALRLPIINTLSPRYDVGTSKSIGYISDKNGGTTIYRYLNNRWESVYPTRERFNQTDTGWSFVKSDGTKEDYDGSGKLLSSTNPNAQTTHFSYDTVGRLSTVTGHFGDTLTYHYDADNYLVSITTPDGDLSYGYDPQGRLSSVTYPDNRERHYHYEDPNYIYHLTGITDENGDRYATWAYDAVGRAILSEHADSAERVEFTYNPDGTTTVTDVAGAERIYHFTVLQGQMKVDHIEGDRCTTCSSGDIQAYTYNSNGFVNSKTDWNGNTTTYTRDVHGRELSRTEAAGTPQARTITTTWDATLNKPLTVTEPDRLTEYTYDTEGRLLNMRQSFLQ